MSAQQRPQILAAFVIIAAILMIWAYFPLSAPSSQPNRFDTALQCLNFAKSKSEAAVAKSGPNTDLIMYSYFETAEAEKNFQFFQRHALHSKADFIIMLNGEYKTDISTLRSLPNVRIIERPNRCFDLGGFHEILTADPTLTTKYKRYIFMNCSLRGPFFPAWAKNVCWSDAYWDQLDTRTKLVGMSWNCANGIPYPPHLQSMILAFSQETLNEILLPKILKCYEDMHSAIADGETKMAQTVMDMGYDVFAFEKRFTAHAGSSGKNASAFLDWCVDQPGQDGPSGGDDILHTGNYGGSTIHPYETIFAKTNRDWDERDRRQIDLLSEHADAEGYSSFDRCV